MLNTPKFKILNYSNSEKNEFLTFLSIIGDQDNFLRSFQFKLKNLSKQNTLNCKANGLYRPFFFLGVSQKILFLDFFNISGKKIATQILEQEIKRQKFSDFFNSEFTPFFEESDFYNENFFFQTFNNGRMPGEGKIKLSFFQKETPKKLCKLFNRDFSSQSFFSKFSKVFLISTSFDFPVVFKGTSFKTKIFSNFACFIIKPKTGFLEMNSKLQFLSCQGLLSRRHFFYFFLLSSKTKLSGIYYFFDNFCRIFSNLTLFLFEPFVDPSNIILTSKNNSKEKKKKKQAFLNFLKTKILKDLIIKRLVQKNFFQSRTSSWILICVVNYIRYLFQKIFSKKESSTWEKNQKIKNSLNKKKKNSRNFNIIYQCGKFLGISETRNLVKLILNKIHKPVKKILFSFLKKKRNDFFLQESVKKIIYKEDDCSELIIQLETKKNKLEIALKIEKDQPRKNFLFRLIRGDQPNIDFWIEAKNIWEILEISWSSKKNNNSTSSLALIPNFLVTSKMSNLLCIQKKQDWKKVLKFLPKSSLGFFLPSFLFSDFYANITDIWTKSSERSYKMLLNFEIFFSETIGRKNFSLDSTNGVELARNFLFQNMTFENFFSLFGMKKILLFNFFKMNQIESSLKKTLSKSRETLFFKNTNLKWILNFLVFEIVSRWRSYEVFVSDKF